MPEQARTVTYVKLIAAMAMWGGTWIAGRVIAQELSAPLAVAALRFVLSGLAVGGFMLLSEGRLPFPESGRDWGLIWALGFFGIFLYGLCFFFGLQRIPAGRGALVVALNPAVIVMTAWLIGKERMTPRKAIGSLIALAGCLTVIGNGDPLASIRRYPSLRAYHDHGSYGDDTMISSTRLVGRSVWNTRWLLIIPAGTFHADRDFALKTLISGADVNGDGTLEQPGIEDIQIGFETYSNSGN